MLRRSSWMAAAVLVFALLQGGAAVAQQSPPEDALAAARELVATMRGADQFKTVMPIIMQQLKPVIENGNFDIYAGDSSTAELTTTLTVSGSPAAPKRKLN